MFELRAVTPRVQSLRQRYRDAIPSLDAERTRIITDYYRMSRNEVPIIRRARALYEILASMTVRVEPDELIVGNVGRYFRGCNIWAEYSGLTWLVDEMDRGVFDTKELADGLMLLAEEDREYLRSVEGFWRESGVSAKVDAALPEELETLVSAAVLPHGLSGNASMPHGHFNANYRKAVEKGFGAIRREALDKLEQMQGRIRGEDAEKYFFYRSIVITCDSVLLFSKRYAAECRAQAKGAADGKRRDALPNGGLPGLDHGKSCAHLPRGGAVLPVIPHRYQHRGEFSRPYDRAHRPAHRRLPQRRHQCGTHHHGGSAGSNGLFLP